MQLHHRVASLRRQGPRRVVQTVASIGEDLLFDRRHGVETGRHVQIGAAGPVRGDHGEHGEAYHPTRVRHFRRVMEALSLPPGLGLLDYGAGKGRVLLLASQQPFRRIVGVEYAESLCQQAQANLAAWRARTGHGHQVEIVHADAAAYEVAPDLHVFYLFNPFGPVVLDKVLHQVHASLRRHPRPAWIIGNKARAGRPVEEHGLFRPLWDLPYGNAEFRVYGTG
ncbi:methyltransferase domain-containing protein [Myxococcota bacterium]|nr:methyltransferase domain-containing protein [Myxococcota bacterium]